MFKGSIVALVTPMFDDGSVDFASLERLVQFHVDAGTDGIVSVGTTGESATLPVDEHVQVVRKTVECASGKIPVIAGSGANSTQEAIELSHAMAGTGIQGFLSVVPYYNKPQQRGIIAHYRAIADATDLPNLLYNVPGRTAVDMLPETVAELAEHKNIVGLKDATGDMAVLDQLQSLCPSDFLLLSGDDPTGLAFMQKGGHGVISVTANVVPQLMATMYDKVTSGNVDNAKAIDDKLQALHRALFIEPNPVMPKYALYKMGLMSTDFLRLPMVVSELESQNELEGILAQLDLIDEVRS